MTVPFRSLLATLIDDLEAAFADSGSNSVTIEHIESNRARNESTFSIQGDPDELLPQLDSIDAEHVQLEEFKITVAPDPDYLDYEDAEIPDC